MTSNRTKKSWPFKWSNTHKWLRKKLDVAIDLTPRSDKPVELLDSDYENLLSIVDKNFVQLGNPVYRGREVVRKVKSKKTGNI
jgi:hypothetical protein